MKLPAMRRRSKKYNVCSADIYQETELDTQEHEDHHMEVTDALLLQEATEEEIQDIRF
jgi:hypothetical protein